MSKESGSHRRTAIVLVLLGGILPLAAYGLASWYSPTITPAVARQWLGGGSQSVVLVDVRPRSVYDKAHIDGAESWPLEAVQAARTADDVPPPLRGRKLLLICNVGASSRLGTAHLVRHGLADAVNVRGGLQEWVRDFAVEATGGPGCPWAAALAEETAPAAPEGGRFERFRNAAGRTLPFPFRVAPPWKQTLAVVSFFLIKPIYTILSFIAIVLLWRSRSPDLVAARWGMIAFFLGENACAVSYLAYRETSYLWEYLHSYGMLVCFGFLTFAILDGFDRRVLGLSSPEKRCAAIGLCGRCVKTAEVSCGLKRVFRIGIPALIVAALMLPTADWQFGSYNTIVFQSPYHYAHLWVFQCFENWYCSGVAVVMLAVSLGYASLRRHNAIGPAKVYFAAGAGAMGFGLLRMVIGAAYDDNRVWYLFWEEGTELLFILGTLLVLLTFRRTLLQERPADGAAS